MGEGRSDRECWNGLFDLGQGIHTGVGEAVELVKCGCALDISRVIVWLGARGESVCGWHGVEHCNHSLVVGDVVDEVVVEWNCEGSGGGEIMGARGLMGVRGSRVEYECEMIEGGVRGALEGRVVVGFEGDFVSMGVCWECMGGKWVGLGVEKDEFRGLTHMLRSEWGVMVCGEKGCLNEILEVSGGGYGGHWIGLVAYDVVCGGAGQHTLIIGRLRGYIVFWMEGVGGHLHFRMRVDGGRVGENGCVRVDYALDWGEWGIVRVVNSWWVEWRCGVERCVLVTMWDLDVTGHEEGVMSGGVLCDCDVSAGRVIFGRVGNIGVGWRCEGMGMGVYGGDGLGGLLWGVFLVHVRYDDTGDTVEVCISTRSGGCVGDTDIVDTEGSSVDGGGVTQGTDSIVLLRSGGLGYDLRSEGVVEREIVFWVLYGWTGVRLDVSDWAEIIEVGMARCDWTQWTWRAVVHSGKSILRLRQWRNWVDDERGRNEVYGGEDEIY
ncbi:hypothetical protein Tco_0797746 [Tanacetum coccineum]